MMLSMMRQKTKCCRNVGFCWTIKVKRKSQFKQANSLKATSMLMIMTIVRKMMALTRLIMNMIVMKTEITMKIMIRHC